jgi:hypothetical protein
MAELSFDVPSRHLTAMKNESDHLAGEEVSVEHVLE